MNNFCTYCGTDLNGKSKCDKCGKASAETGVNNLVDKVKNYDYKGKLDNLKSNFENSNNKNNSDFLLPDEQIVMQGSANKRQLGGLASKGGTLILTNQRLIFKSHIFNIGSSFDAIPLSDIATGENTLNILMPTPNMIRVITKDGTNHGFIVTGKQKDEWKEKINNLVHNISNDEISKAR